MALKALRRGSVVSKTVDTMSRSAILRPGNSIHFQYLPLYLATPPSVALMLHHTPCHGLPLASSCSQAMSRNVSEGHFGNSHNDLDASVAGWCAAGSLFCCCNLLASSLGTYCKLLYARTEATTWLVVDIPIEKCSEARPYNHIKGAPFQYTPAHSQPATSASRRPTASFVFSSSGSASAKCRSSSNWVPGGLNFPQCTWS